MSQSGSGYRLGHFWLDGGGQKNKSAMRTRSFYRLWNGLVTSLWSLYDITGDVPNASLAVPGNIGKRLNCKPVAAKNEEGGATVTKAWGPSNRTGAERLDTVVP